MTPAQSQLAESQMGLVKSIAGSAFRRIRGRIDYDELVSVGNLALVQCIGSFDDAKGTLKTFVYRRVWGAMIDFMRAEDPVSRGRRKEVGSSFQVSQQFADEAEETGLKLSSLRSCFVDPQAAAIRSEIFEKLDNYPTSNPRDRAVMHATFIEDKRQAEIASEMGMSCGRVSQILGAESLKLRSHLGIC